MLEHFRESAKDTRKTSRKRTGVRKEETENIESNLTKSEIAGMRSLQKRVMNNELIINETDKSRKFVCIENRTILCIRIKAHR